MQKTFTENNLVKKLISTTPPHFVQLTPTMSSREGTSSSSSSSNGANSSSSSSQPNGDLANIQPTVSTAAANKMKKIKRKNIRKRTRKKYNNALKHVWDWLQTQEAMAPYLNEDGSLNEQGCHVWCQGSQWFSAFIGSLTTEIEEDADDSDDDGEVILMKGLSSMEGYRSAINKYIEEMGTGILNDNYRSEMKLLFNGLSRNDADKNMVSGKTTGKKNMRFETYHACAQAGLQTANGLFMVCYLCLCWNMMCRTNNCAQLVFEHLVSHIAIHRKIPEP